MAMKRDDDGWWIVGLLIVGGLSLLYYAQTGLGKDKDSALIPGELEGKIDYLIAALNDRFGKRWVDFGIVALKQSLHILLPASLVRLVDIVATVEKMSKGLMTSQEKHRLAVQMARGL